MLPLIGIIFRFEIIQKNVISIIYNKEFLSSLFLSIETASISTAICLATGVPLAYLIARTTSRFVLILKVIVALPLAIPPLLSGALLLNVYGNFSLIGSTFQYMGISLTQSPLGIIFAQVFVISPFVILTSINGFENVDKNYENVSRILGKNIAYTFFMVIIPLAAREIVAGAVLSWIRAIGEFGANVMMAYNPKTISIQLWEYNAIGGLSLVLPGLAIVLIFSFASLGLLFGLLYFNNTERLRKKGN